MTFEDAVQAIQPGSYRHFKGNEYEVIGVARQSETEEPMVVYRALYGEGGLWVRPAEMWNESVERNGKIYHRFYRLDRIERVEKYTTLTITRLTLAMRLFQVRLWSTISITRSAPPTISAGTSWTPRCWPASALNAPLPGNTRRSSSGWWSARPGGRERMP